MLTLVSLAGKAVRCTATEPPPWYAFTMATPDDQLIEKINRLPAERRAEVEDFIDFISQRDSDLQLTRAATRTAEPAFAKVWSNPEDDVYDRA
jgi:hypothetical protein